MDKQLIESELVDDTDGLRQRIVRLKGQPSEDERAEMYFRELASACPAGQEDPTPVAQELIVLARRARRRADDANWRAVRWGWANIVLGLLTALGAGVSGVATAAGVGKGTANANIYFGVLAVGAGALGGLAATLNTARTTQTAKLAKDAYEHFAEGIWQFFAKHITDCDKTVWAKELDARDKEFKEIERIVETGPRRLGRTSST